MDSRGRGSFSAQGRFVVKALARGGWRDFSDPVAGCIVLDFRAMASPLLWLEALAGLKALYDLSQGAVDYWKSYTRHRRERATVLESRRISEAFSTYSDDEVRELIRKIEGCRDRFIKQGSGRDRARCICSIFNEIADGNGGILPAIDDWQRMYDQLRCGEAR
jgi:hypothetical protein